MNFSILKSQEKIYTPKSITQSLPKYQQFECVVECPVCLYKSKRRFTLSGRIKQCAKCKACIQLPKDLEQSIQK